MQLKALKATKDWKSKWFSHPSLPVAWQCARKGNLRAGDSRHCHGCRLIPVMWINHLDIPPERSLGGWERWVVRNDCSFFTALAEAEQVPPIVLWVELLWLLEEVIYRRLGLTSPLRGGIAIPRAFCQTLLDFTPWHPVNSRPKNLCQEVTFLKPAKTRANIPLLYKVISELSLSNSTCWGSGLVSIQ